MVREKIGSGAFGNVYKLGDKCVKEIKQKDTCSGINYTVLREIALLQILNSENVDCVVKLYGYSFNKSVEITMEYGGISLLTYIQNTLTPIRLMNYDGIKNNLLRAINILHSMKIMHRDIKPENILINEKTNDIKLCDFGLSIYTLDQCKTYITYNTYNEFRNCLTTEVCTLNYRAPELFVDDCVYNNKIDIWSLGCVLFQLITRSLLFPGMTKETVLRGIVYQTKPTIEELNNFPITCGDASFNWKERVTTFTSNKEILSEIEKMLCFDPEKRYSFLDDRNKENKENKENKNENNNEKIKYPIIDKSLIKRRNNCVKILIEKELIDPISRCSILTAIDICDLIFITAAASTDATVVKYTDDKIIEGCLFIASKIHGDEIDDTLENQNIERVILEFLRNKQIPYKTILDQLDIEKIYTNFKNKPATDQKIWNATVKLISNYENLQNKTNNELLEILIG